MQNSHTLGRSRPSTRKFSTKKILLFASLAAGCGGGYLKTSTPMTPATQNASVTGQYNLVLTSTNGHGTTNIYTDFTQAGTTFTGAANTLVCPSNDLSQCKGNDASITPSGTVSGANVTMMISFPSTAGAPNPPKGGDAPATNNSSRPTHTCQGH